MTILQVLLTFVIFSTATLALVLATGVAVSIAYSLITLTHEFTLILIDKITEKLKL